MTNEKTSKQEIKLLPWLHSILQRPHHEIVKYISNLKPGSFIALEIEHMSYFEFKCLVDVSLGVDPSQGLPEGESKRIAREIYNHPIDYIIQVNPSLLAMLELYFEAKKHNHVLIPIENRDLLIQSSTGSYNEKLDERNIDLIGQKRENAFVKNIIDAKSRINDDLYVITGLAHTLPIKKALEKKGLNVKIDYNPFSDKNKIEEMMKLHERLREILTMKQRNIGSRSLDEELKRIHENIRILSLSSKIVNSSILYRTQLKILENFPNVNEFMERLVQRRERLHEFRYAFRFSRIKNHHPR